MNITTKQTLPVDGMSCASCAISVESILSAQEGVKHASVNFAAATVAIEYDPAHTSPDALREPLRMLGYDLQSADVSYELRQEERRVHLHSMKRDALAALLLALPVVVGEMFLSHSLPWLNWLALPLTAVIVFGYGRGFFARAYAQLRTLHFSMDTLIALSTSIAFCWSAFALFFHDWLMNYGIHPAVYFESAAVIVAFILVGKYLEERAKQQSAAAISSLVALQPKTLRVLRDGNEQDIPAESVVYGDSILLRPGERLPVDGIVRNGRSFVDESMLTGESVPIEKVHGDTVYAGTLNQHGSLVIEARGIGKNTLLSSIIRAVEEAQGSKAPVQHVVDRIAAVFVPAVLAIAALSFILWLVFAPEHALTHALSSAIAVLIIACPCALGLATPTALMVGIGNGARHGVLIRNAEALERAHHISAIVFDKTGTLTIGKPAVRQVQWYAKEHNEDERKNIYASIYAIEARSEHPFAFAIHDYLSAYRRQDVEADDVQAVAGKGVRAMLKGKAYYIGNAAYMEEHAITVPDVSVFEFEGTVVYCALEHTLLCSFTLSDMLKEDAIAAVRELKHLHITPHLLTGDVADIANVVAAQVGIEHVVAQTQPRQKQEYVEMLKQSGEVVAMVGDGINDAQALAVADVSIAMGKGTETAMNTAHITLMNSDLRSILHAIRLSRATVRIIRQNLFWAFGYNVILIPLAAGVLYPFNGFQLNHIVAGAAMALSSVSVVSNSLRLRKV